jgi:hypothetical protein
VFGVLLGVHAPDHASFCGRGFARHEEQTLIAAPGHAEAVRGGAAMAEEAEVAYFTAIADYDPEGQEVRCSDAAAPAVRCVCGAALRSR